jgi:hypothetical protein
MIYVCPHLLFIYLSHNDNWTRVRRPGFDSAPVHAFPLSHNALLFIFKTES